MNYQHLENISKENIIVNNNIINILTKAYQNIGELNGSIDTIPNSNILINTLPLLESKSSSEIEQIITTHDEIFKSFDDKTLTNQAKEVQIYAKALRYGCDFVKENGYISINLLIKIANMVNGNDAGVRKQAGTNLKNEKGEVVYIPPQNYDDVIKYLTKLEGFINNKTSDNSLIKMIMIHYYFESIHPFYDGNGRVGRILNILFLIKEGILKEPILYLSGAIIQNKSMYYKTLAEVTNNNIWEPFVEYMLYCLASSSNTGLISILEIRKLLEETKLEIRENYLNIYSHELLNTLFMHPYVKVEYVEKNISKTRQTASKYLKKLVDLNILEKIKVGTSNYYVNNKLLDIFKNIEY